MNPNHFFTFSDMMVRAVLSGQKTQRTSLVKAVSHEDRGKLKDPSSWPVGHWVDDYYFEDATGEIYFRYTGTPYEVEDEWWVRERWGVCDTPWRRLCYQADRGQSYCGMPENGKWNSAKDMPKSVARIILKIAGSRFLRLHDFTESDARCEGFDSLQSIKAWWDGRPDGKDMPWIMNPWAHIVYFVKVRP
jgi:hypothetical protein